MNKLIVKEIPDIQTVAGPRPIYSRATIPCVIAQTQYGSVNSVHCVPSADFDGEIVIKTYVSNKPEDDLATVPAHAIELSTHTATIDSDESVLIDGITTACSLLFFEFTGTHDAGEVEVWINSHSLF